MDKKLTEKISNYIGNNNLLKVIPIDLANIFFDLNDKIRENIRKIIKY